MDYRGFYADGDIVRCDLIPYAELHESPEARAVQLNAERYARLRVEAYARMGATAEAWAIARVQQDVDGDDSEVERLAAVRSLVKAAFPKPTNEPA